MHSIDSTSLLLDIAAIDRKSISAQVRRFAEFSMYDWLVVARAGSDQRVSQIIRGFVEAERGRPAASVIGSRSKVPARLAALANGTISHALDYDDTHFAHVGHPSVAIMPAALAVAEEIGASACDARDAFLLGAEASCRIGMVLGRAHYERGFHQTATAGAIGATIAAGRLYGLPADQLRSALSLISTRAAGLKSQFGTMGKPYNAGIAAANGVEVAALARRGFSSCDDGIGGPQGFIETHSDNPDRLTPWLNAPPKSFIFEDIKYKLHACCHGTHAMIEALREIQGKFDVGPTGVVGLEVRTNPRWLKVCDIRQPRTGLEAKFSYRFLAAMVLSGIDTASESVFDDSICNKPHLLRLAQHVRITGDESLSDTTCTIILDDGSHRRMATHDLAQRQSEVALEKGLRAKAKGLLGASTAEALWTKIAALDGLSARDLAALLNG
jgi:2-methylcitrate dehydratase PrpD